VKLVIYENHLTIESEGPQDNAYLEKIGFKFGGYKAGSKMIVDCTTLTVCGGPQNGDYHKINIRRNIAPTE
jgi:hypothetical protein